MCCGFERKKKVFRQCLCVMYVVRTIINQQSVISQFKISLSLHLYLTTIKLLSHFVLLLVYFVEVVDPDIALVIGRQLL